VSKWLTAFIWGNARTFCGEVWKDGGGGNIRGCGNHFLFLKVCELNPLLREGSDKEAQK